MDLVFIFFSLFLLQFVLGMEYFQFSRMKWPQILMFIFYFVIFSSVFEMYNLQKSSKMESIFNTIVLASALTVLFYLLTPVLSPSLPAQRQEILYFLLAIILALTTWRFLYIILISAPRFYKKVLLITGVDDVTSIVYDLEKPDPNYKVVAIFNMGKEVQHIPGIRMVDLDEITKTAAELRVSEVVIASRMPNGMTVPLNKILLELLQKGMPIRSFQSVYEGLTQRIPVRHVSRDFYRYFPFSRSNQNKLYLLFSRMMDIISSLLGLLFCVLITPFIFIGNLFYNKGPLIYKQDRVGRNGKVFQVYKFRSMVVNAEENGPQYSRTGDTRVTRFGRFLRRSRLDESPQFWNVLTGDMSMIGPRPERPEFVEVLTEKIPFYEVRHVIKPGITGWAQVNAKYGENEDDSLEKLQYDLYYIKHRSVLMDFSIIIKTLSTIVFFRGQ